MSHNSGNLNEHTLLFNFSTFAATATVSAVATTSNTTASIAENWTYPGTVVPREEVGNKVIVTLLLFLIVIVTFVGMHDCLCLI